MNKQIIYFLIIGSTGVLIDYLVYILLLSFIPINLSLALVFAQDVQYSMEDYNSTSPTYGMDVWYPEYVDYITLHYFSTQG